MCVCDKYSSIIKQRTLNKYATNITHQDLIITLEISARCSIPYSMESKKTIPAWKGGWRSVLGCNEKALGEFPNMWFDFMIL